MTGFNAQVGGCLYRIQIETDRKEVYDEIQRVAREFVDAENTAVDGTTKVCSYPLKDEKCFTCIHKDTRPDNMPCCDCGHCNPFLSLRTTHFEHVRDAENEA